jgi:Response regulator with putative antiterminator output domain
MPRRTAASRHSMVVVPDQSAFDDAVASMSAAFDTHGSLCQPFVTALPVAGAAISVLDRAFGFETVCASDSQAARLDELQLDLGEGPCWDALCSRKPVLNPDIQGDTRGLWPILAEAIRSDPVGSLHSFPLVIGSLDIGAVDLYSPRRCTLTADEIIDAEALATIAARQVLRRALASRDSQSDADRPFSRRVVHQATGMVLVQLGVSASDALLIIRGHAYANNRPVIDVARDIVERRLDLSTEDHEI